MDLQTQFMSMGIPADKAEEFSNAFFKSLKDMGMSDAEPTKELVEIIKKNDKLEKMLLQVQVRPELVKKYANSLDQAMLEFNIETKNRKCMFLAQVLHESGMLTAVTENLNYSELGLVKVFKKYFDRTKAKKYARQPEKIANLVYANRLGNGDEESGDGWKYRGRGLIQLTGKDNYLACGKDLNEDLIKNPSYLETPIGAARSAGWFWESRKLNKTADIGDITTNTKIINGGHNGLEHRIILYKKLMAVFVP